MTNANPPAEQTLHKIISERPPVHPKRDGSERCIGLHADALQYLYPQLSPNNHTLETGCGLSTLVFALAGCHHQSIVPNPAHIEETRKHAQNYNISFDCVTFHEARSEEILPQLQEPTALDVVLIDGGHAFPIPFIDWFYTSHRLAVNGLLIVDDIGLKSVGVLYDFLNKQPEWQKEKVVRRTAFFRKKEDANLDFEWDHWHKQPFNNQLRTRLQHQYMLWRQRFRKMNKG